VGFLGIVAAVGKSTCHTYLADGNFNGWRWLQHWQNQYRATVITKPPHNERRPWSPQWERWLSQHRQIVETVFALLGQVFAIKNLNAHSRWGQYTRIALKTVAFNLGMVFNRLLNRPLLALGTLLVG
jgi:hypothetical protein